MTLGASETTAKGTRLCGWTVSDPKLAVVANAKTPARNRVPDQAIPFAIHISSPVELQALCGQKINLTIEGIANRSAIKCISTAFVLKFRRVNN